MYRIDFTRSYYKAPKALIAKMGEIVVEQSRGWEKSICQEFLKTNPDAPDGAVEFWDDGAHLGGDKIRTTPLRCLSAPSLHRLAALAKEEGLEAVGFDMSSTGEETKSVRWFDAIEMLLANPSAWTQIPIKTRGYLIKNNYVIVADDKNSATVTDAGKSAEQETSRNTISSSQLEALKIALRYDAKKWAELAQARGTSRTTNFMLQQGWVEIRAGYPCVTPKGEAIAAENGLVRPASAVMPKAAEKAEPIQAFVQPGEKKVHWTEGQKEAFQIALKGNTAGWRALHGKTQNTMIREEWVTVSPGGKPSVTEKGIRMAVLNSVPVK